MVAYYDMTLAQMDVKKLFSMVIWRNIFTFVRQKNDLLVVGYVDTDYAGDLDDWRSTMCNTPKISLG